MKLLHFYFFIFLLTFGCKNKIDDNKKILKENKWVFIMAGQSNMAGRGIIEPQDTITYKSILALNKNLQFIKAKEPLHFYEPELAGLDCGLAFAKEIKNQISDSIQILLVPCAVGGSSINQWIGDSIHRNVKLYSNFKQRLNYAKTIGTVKGILWHQGESDANIQNLPTYQKKLELLFNNFRKEAKNSELPILAGELGTYSVPKTKNQNWKTLNEVLHKMAKDNLNLFIISSENLNCNADSVHFNSEAQRTLGKRFALKYLDKFYNKK